MTDSMLDKQRKQAESLEGRIAMDKLPGLVNKLEKLVDKLQDIAYPAYTVTNGKPKLLRPVEGDGPSCWGDTFSMGDTQPEWMGTAAYNKLIGDND